MRRSRHASASGQSRGQIVDAISIRKRPAEAEDRVIPGHWEGDLLAGAKNSYIAALVERHSRFAYADQGAEQRNGSGRRRTESACS
jgi:IS30 family transposase